VSAALFVWPQSPWWNNAAPYVFAMLSCATGHAAGARGLRHAPRLSAPLDHFMLAWAAFGVVCGAWLHSLARALDGFAW
jgi:hypothetical protein